MNPEQKHDFLNNALKIEIIQKLIEKNLENNSEIPSDMLRDLLELYKHQEALLNQYTLS